jgi:inorganic pyrophosphatase
LELRNYFEQYKVLENKQVQIDAFQSKEEAYEVINEAIAYYGKSSPDAGI